MMQVRGSAGEHSEAKGGLYDVSNRERMGLTEFEVINKHNTRAQVVKLGLGRFIYCHIPTPTPTQL